MLWVPRVGFVVGVPAVRKEAGVARAGGAVVRYTLIDAFLLFVLVVGFVVLDALLSLL